MKKGKNITLLLGGICMAVQFCLYVVMLCEYLSHEISGDALSLLILYTAICVLAATFSIILTVWNCKDNSGKILPISSIIINCIGLCMAVLLVIANLPTLLIISKLNFGFSKAYIRFFINYLLIDFRFFAILGHLLIMIGSILSLLKKKAQASAKQEITTT